MRSLKHLVLCICWLSATGLIAQVTDRNQNLLSLSNEYDRSFNIENAQARARALEMGWPLKGLTEDGRVYELVRLDMSGKPMYYIQTNAGGASLIKTSSLFAGGPAGLSLSGNGQLLGIWDGGAVRATHNEFGGRVSIGDASIIDDHATHVGGTMIASGEFMLASKGMSPSANLLSYDWNNDQSEMAAAAANDGIPVSQHSYGIITGWAWGSWSGTTGWHWFGAASISAVEDVNFGYYSDQARDWDNIAFTAKDYLIVKSAGNDRGRGPAPGTEHYFWNGSWTLSTAVRDVDGGADGYDCISHAGVAKNIMSVGAIQSNLSMASFSSWGPADDGRIKPDIVAKGVNVYSTGFLADDDYYFSSGTSMSGPMISGSVGILQEHWANIFPDQPKPWSSTIKGIILHTAVDLGNPGPDYAFGWGLMDTEAAANFMTQSLPEQLVQETLNNATTYEYAFAYDGSAPLKFTLCWTDPAGPILGLSLNNRTPVLVNDLDLRLINNANGTIYFPYKLDPDNPSSNATTADNLVDNVEMIDPGILPPGNYTLTVSHKGSLSGGAQDFSLLSSGPITPLSLAFLNLRAEERQGAGYLQWETEPARIDDRFIVEKSRDGQVFMALDTVFPELHASSFDYVDKHLSGSPIWYYRIRSVDALGVSNLSYIVHIRPQEAMSQILVYPNPGVATCYIEANRALKSISVMDTFGKIIWYEDAADTNRSSGRHFELNAIDWIPGLYIIEAIDTSGQRSQVKWLKSR